MIVDATAQDDKHMSFSSRSHKFSFLSLASYRFMDPENRSQLLSSLAVEQLRGLIAGNLHVESDGIQTEIFNEQEIVLLILAWIDDFHDNTLRKLQSIQKSTVSNKFYIDSHAESNLQAAIDAYRSFAGSMDAYVASLYSDYEEDSLLYAAFTYIKRSYELTAQVQADSKRSYRRDISLEQKMVLYAPYWLPLVIPLLRFNREVTTG